MSKPNIILVLADDLDVASMRHLSRIRSLLADEGVEFRQSFVSNALCCPSRATLLRGQYPHNHGVLTNRMPNGGFARFFKDGREASTLATWLKDAGYRTVLLGKYLNHYPADSDPTYVPPGWSEWYATIGDATSRGFRYRIVEGRGDGSAARIISYGDRDADYLTDVLLRKSVAFIERTRDQPFFLFLSVSVPRGPATPARRHQNAFANVRLRGEHPDATSFNEGDVSDKPRWIRRIPRLTRPAKDALQKLHRKRLQSMLAVEEAVATLIETLDSEGLLGNTYIVFSSDNGYHLGEHRLFGKGTVYEEGVRVPLIVRGPGVPRGEKRDHLVLNNDLAPTFAEWAGAAVPVWVDGRSLAPLLRAESPPENQWRKYVLLVHDRAPKGRDGNGSEAGVPALRAVRSKKYAYIEIPAGGDRELYDLEADPAELVNLSGSAPRKDDERLLEEKLRRLSKCKAAACRQAEDGL